MPVDKSLNYTTMYSLNADFVYDVFHNDYARNLSTTVFDEFLTRVSGGDINLIYRIWEMIGYVITPDNFGRSFFVIQGVPASGKSTIERLLMKMFSPGSVFKVNGEELGSKFVFQGLECKAIMIVSDMPDKDISRAGVSAIKKITGRDGINSDVKYRERTQFETNAKIVCFTNYPFSSESYDEALYDRAVPIPCRYSIPKSEQDFTLDDKLEMEISAIATKALYYYIILRMNNYQFAGRYTMNECVQSGAFTDYSFRTSVYCLSRRIISPTLKELFPLLKLTGCSAICSDGSSTGKDFRYIFAQRQWRCLELSGIKFDWITTKILGVL